MSASLITAVIAGAVALLSLVISSRSARTTLRLQHDLEERRRLATKDQLVQEVMTRYRDPLLYATFDLASRIYNIVKRDFLRSYMAADSFRREYAVTSTLFLFGQFFGWMEVLRRGVQYLDLGDVDRTRRLAEGLEAVSMAIASDRIADADFMVYRSHIRALGECMLEHERDGAGSTLQCIGYVSFSDRMDDPHFSKWFSNLQTSIERTAAAGPAEYQRLVRIQHALIDLIDILDDPPVRLAAGRRQKIDA